MTTVIWIAVGIAIGYFISWSQNRAQKEKFDAYKEKATKLVDEAVATVNKMSTEMQEMAENGEKKDQVFQELIELCNRSVDMSSNLETQNTKLSEDLNELRVRYERTLAALN